MQKIIKYGFFGGLTAGIEFLSFAAMKFIFSPEDNLWIGIISAISFALGLICSFLFNKYFVFQQKEKRSKEAVQFLGLGLINLFLSSALTVSLSNFMDPIFAKIITIGMIVVWNFILMNCIIFKKPAS